MSRLDLKRILARCIEDGDCLIWQGKVYKSGAPAGTEWVDGKDRHVGVRRRAYEEYNKVTLQQHEQVTTCGNPACLAKAHLKISTASDRSRRSWEKMDAATRLRRSMKLSAWQQANNGKLTPEVVAAIRESEDGPYVTAKRLGVSGVCASRVKQGTSYKDYTEVNPWAGLGA